MDGENDVRPSDDRRIRNDQDAKLEIGTGDDVKGKQCEWVDLSVVAGGRNQTSAQV